MTSLVVVPIVSTKEAPPIKSFFQLLLRMVEKTLKKGSFQTIFLKML